MTGEVNMRDDLDIRADAAVRAALSGQADAELIARLQELDWDTLPFMILVSDRQNAAVMLEIQRIIEADGVDVLSAQGRQRIAGFLYGFQMGHDYAVKYGPLYQAEKAKH